MSVVPPAPRPRWRPADQRAAEHAALASPVRLRLMDTLAAAGGPAHVDDIASELALHPNTVRGHLALLLETGFVAQIVEHSGRPGRPQVRYRLTAKACVGSAGCLGYRTLVSVLTSYVCRVSPVAGTSGERAGQAWATRVAAGPLDRPAQAEFVEAIRAALEEFGFATEIAAGEEGTVLQDRTCPFAGVVDDHPELLCGIHRGLLGGLIEAHGAHLDLVDLTPGIPEQPCVARLEPRSSEL